MLVKILGGIDLIAGLVLIFGAGGDLPSQLLVILGVVLLAKSGLGLLGDFGSWVDLSSGIVLLLSAILTLPWFISFICGVLIIQKGIFSFFGEG
ncbi:MAG: hypothetical protein ABIA78_00190 [archaeon]